MRPIIGITLNTRLNLTSYYVTSVAQAGGAPLILGEVPAVYHLEPILKELDGLIFSGGTDISPHFYQEYPMKGLGKVKPYRDAFEYQLLKDSLTEYSFPILGICRGMQLINVYHGGSLYQCLDRKEPPGLKHGLMETYPLAYPVHSITVEEGSRLYSLLQKTTLQVNSLHHQGIKVVGKNLQPVGKAPDGLVEALEREGDRFVLGVQWHPELMTETCKEAAQLFQEFILTCASFSRG